MFPTHYTTDGFKTKQNDNDQQQSSVAGVSGDLRLVGECVCRPYPQGDCST